MPIYKTKNEDFFKTWTPQMAYVLGFFAADGSMYKTRRGTHFIEFQITDGVLLQEIRNALGSNHKISIRDARSEGQKRIYRFQIGSKTIFTNLKRLGLKQNKSLSLRWPKIPGKFLGDFVRGYFDGDGGVHFGKYWRKNRKSWKWEFTVRFTSGSRVFLLGLWRTLRKHVQGGCITKKATSGYDLSFGRHDSVALFHLMYDNITSGIFLRRKFEIFEKAFRVLDMRA